MGTKYGTTFNKIGAVLGVPRILPGGKKLYQSGLGGKCHLIRSWGTAGVLRPSADLVGLGWPGFSIASGGAGGVVSGIFPGPGISTKTVTGCDLGKGIGNSLHPPPGRLAGSRCKGGSLLADCTILGGFRRCKGCQGPEGLSNFCVLSGAGAGGGVAGGGNGGNGGKGELGYTTVVQVQGGGGGGTGGGMTTVFSHDGATSGTTNTRPDLNLQYRVATTVAVIPSNKVAKIITSTIVHVTSTAAIHFK